MGGRHGPAQHREVLAKHIDLTPVDRAPSGDNAIPGWLLGLHPEIGAAMGDEHVELFKAVFVQQKIDTLARAQLATPVLGIDPLLAAPKARRVAAAVEFAEDVFHRLGSQKSKRRAGAFCRYKH